MASENARYSYSSDIVFYYIVTCRTILSEKDATNKKQVKKTNALKISLRRPLINYETFAEALAGETILLPQSCLAPCLVSCCLPVILHLAVNAML